MQRVLEEAERQETPRPSEPSALPPLGAPIDLPPPPRIGPSRADPVLRP
jgi:hypothetical protein